MGGEGSQARIAQWVGSTSGSATDASADVMDSSNANSKETRLSGTNRAVTVAILEHLGDLAPVFGDDR